MSAQSRRLALVLVLLIGALLGVWIPAVTDGSLSSGQPIEGSSSPSYLFMADTDPYAQSGDQTLVASPYDLGLSGLAAFPISIMNWHGTDVGGQATAELGLSAEQQIFRSYVDGQGRLVWLRLLTTNDWEVFDHRPPVCYFYNNYEMGPETTYSLPIGEASLRMRGFVAHQGEINQLVLYTFLWPNKYRDMAKGATMVELVAPFSDDKDKGLQVAEEFAKLIFSDNLSSLPQTGILAFQYPVNANLDDKVNLLGYDLSSSTVQPRETLRLTLYWQARGIIDEDYTVFVHVLNPSGDSAPPILVQQDRQPFDGMYPTSKWKVGQIVKEVYELTMPGDVVAANRELEVGMYLLSTQRRLNVLSANGKQMGNSITLRPVFVGNQAP